MTLTDRSRAEATSQLAGWDRNSRLVTGERLLRPSEEGLAMTPIGGLCGCPFAQDTLVGNIPTENVIAALHQRSVNSAIRTDNVTQLNAKIAAEFV